MEWRQYAKCHVFEDERNEALTASILQGMMNIMRGKDQKPFVLEDFRLHFGDHVPEEKPKPNWRVHKEHIKLMLEVEKAKKQAGGE